MGQGTVEIKTRGTRGLDRNFSCQARFEFFDHTGKTFVYWGTPKLKAALEATAWPRVYRDRTEIQENGFKRMIDHGALETNYGRKKLVGPDRHQQRKREDLEASLATASSGWTKRSKRSKSNRPRWQSPRPKDMANAWSSVSKAC